MFITESEYQSLKRKAALWDRFSPKLVGNLGEDIIARLILAERIFGNKDHDLVFRDKATRKKIKLEVKTARLTKYPSVSLSDDVLLVPSIIAKKGGQRWKWGKIFGNAVIRSKTFDRLLLVGVRKNQPTVDDPINPDKNPDDDWDIFDLSYEDFKKCTGSTQGTIQYSPNPLRVFQNKTRSILESRKVKISVLKERYGN